MKRNQFVKNPFGVTIKMCCASCACKDISRSMNERICTKHIKNVRACEVCNSWQMSQLMKSFRITPGQVKRREYQLYLLAVRQEEERNGVAEGKSIEEIRAEFESQFGSIFLDGAPTC